LGSLNGTFVGQTRISDATVLPSGSIVTVGAITFRTDYDDAMQQSAPSVADKATGVASVAAGSAASPMEQTLEMSEPEPPMTEPTEGVERNGGIHFDWLEESADSSESPPINSQLPANEPELPAAEQSEASAMEEEISYHEAADADQNGSSDGGNEFAPPAPNSATGSDDDDDLRDFLASLN
jgi:hypothetical protein